MNQNKIFRHITKCLIDGKIHEYDICVGIVKDLNENGLSKLDKLQAKKFRIDHAIEQEKSIEWFNDVSSRFKLIGIGCIYSINGTIQGYTEVIDGIIKQKEEYTDSYWFFKK